MCCAAASVAAAPPEAPSYESSRRTAPSVVSAVEPLPAPSDVTESVEPVEGALAGGDDRGARWRYRYHCQRWWYTDVPGHWFFWDGHCWQDAQPMVTKRLPDGSVQRVGLVRRALAAWPQVPSYHEHHGWIGGFYSSGGGYGSSDFGYGYGIPNYGPWPPD